MMGLLSTSGCSTTQLQDSSSHSDGSKKYWSRAEVLGLLQIYGQKRASFKDPKIKNKLIWEQVGEEMKSMGFQELDPKCCETKFKI